MWQLFQHFKSGEKEDEQPKLLTLGAELECPCGIQSFGECKLGWGRPVQIR